MYMNSLGVHQILIDQLQTSSCVARCGPGLSIQAGLPGWSKLGEELIHECSNKGLNKRERSELYEMLRLKYLDDVADFCRGFLGDNEYQYLLDRLFRRKDMAPSLLHQ
jgi:hypothetical protein